MSLPNVPMQLPDGFNNPAEYREYLSFKVQIQMLYSLTHQKDSSRSGILALIKNMRKRSNNFPPQSFPKNIQVYDFKQGTTIFCNPDELIADTYKFFGIRDVEIKEIKTTQDLSEALARIEQMNKPN